MRQEIAVPSTYHQERLDKTAPFWPDSGIVFAAQLPKKHFHQNALGEIEPTTPMDSYLSSLGLSYSQVGQLYTADSKIIPASTEDFDLSQQPIDGVMWYFLGTAEKHMQVINRAMAGPRYKEIKNSHGYEHARKAIRLGLPILRSLHNAEIITEEEMQTGVAALGLHDVANAVGRINHSSHGVRMVRRMYPHLKMTDHQAKVFDHTVLLHDGDDVLPLLEGLGNVPIENAIEFLAQFGPVPMVLIVADKADVGIQRLPQGKNVPKLDYHNIHRIINLHWNTEYLGLDENCEILDMQLSYGKQITPEEALLIPGYVTTQENGVIERKTARAIKDGHGKADREGQYDKLVSGYWSEYYPRTMLAVMAAFAMNPLLQEMNVTMYNVHTNNPDNPNNTFTFRRDTLAKDMYDVSQEFVPEDRKSKSEYAHYANYIKYEKAAV